MEKYYRSRREINRLYQPLYADDGLSDGEDEAPGQPYAPLSYLPPPVTSNNPSKQVPKSHRPRQDSEASIHISNVWDERVYDIGHADDDDDEPLVKGNGKI